MTEENPEAAKPNGPKEMFEQQPERPLECGQCQKPANVRYTEIVGKCKHTLIMCKDCPNLRMRLHGSHEQAEELTHGSIASGLTCGNCHTTWESARMGNPLGCSECYAIFGQALLEDLISSETVPKRLAVKQKGLPAHVGRAPGEVAALNPKLRLIALNEALTATLSREDYEQAAWIRDQINELTTGGSDELSE